MCGGAIISDYVPNPRGSRRLPTDDLWSELDTFSDLSSDRKSDGVKDRLSQSSSRKKTTTKPKPTSLDSKGTDFLEMYEASLSYFFRQDLGFASC